MVGDDGLGVQDDGVGVAFETGVAEAFENGFDGSGREREGDDGGVLAATGLLRERVVDTLVVEDREDGLALARRNHHLYEAHGVCVTVWWVKSSGLCG
ncbi:MAG: hypothetical protein ABEI99_11555, partial [Halobaculum sp.]